MPNWYQDEKIKKKFKDFVTPVALMAPLSLVGLLPKGKVPPTPPAVVNHHQSPVHQVLRPKPSTKPTTRPTSKPAEQSNIVNMLKQHEGYRTKTYLDSKGIPTIGIGFNLQKSTAKAQIEALGLDYDKVVAGNQTLTDDQVLSLFNQDLATAKSDLASVIPNLSDHPQKVQDVLIDMMFNLGKTRFSNFSKMIAAINAKDYPKASEEMVNSKWNEQVGNRATELVGLMTSANQS